MTFTVYGVPQPAGSKTIGRTRTGGAFVRDAAKRSRPWKNDVAQQAGIAMIGRELLDGALSLDVTFNVARPKGHYGARGLRPSAPDHPTTRPDVTKLLRAVEDAMTGIVWHDDSQIVLQVARKVYRTPAGCAITVRPVTELRTAA